MVLRIQLISTLSAAALMLGGCSPIEPIASDRPVTTRAQAKAKQAEEQRRIDRRDVLRAER